MTPLERAYRRLLILYPRSFRRQVPVHDSTVAALADYGRRRDIDARMR